MLELQLEKLLFKSLLEILKKIVTVLMISALVTKANKKDDMILEKFFTSIILLSLKK